MSISKKPLKTKPVCKVTFKAEKTLVGEAETVAIAGEFNNWTPEAMKGSKAGDYSITLDLETGREYAFRYVLNGDQWINDPEADRYVVGSYGAEDGIIVL